MLQLLKMIIIGIMAFLMIIYSAIFGGETISKDTIINTYDNVLQLLGEDLLTSDKKLKGQREFGKDSYVGTYKVEYKKFTGTEYIFGGTTIERKDGDKIHVKIEIRNSNGEIGIIMKLKENSSVIATQNGTYEFDFNIKSGSNYLIIKAKNYSGDVKIKVE